VATLDRQTQLERAHQADGLAASTWPWAPTAAPTAERIASPPRGASPGCARP
jgi:hypothetical protein